MLDLMNPKRFSLVKNASEIFQFAIKIRYMSKLRVYTYLFNFSITVAFLICGALDTCTLNMKKRKTAL